MLNERPSVLWCSHPQLVSYLLTETSHFCCGRARWAGVLSTNHSLSIIHYVPGAADHNGSPRGLLNFGQLEWLGFDVACSRFLAWPGKLGKGLIDCLCMSPCCLTVLCLCILVFVEFIKISGEACSAYASVVLLRLLEHSLFKWEFHPSSSVLPGICDLVGNI